MAQTLVNQRLNKLVKLLGITKKEFEKASGLSNGFIDKAGDSIRQDKVDKILLAYPNVSQVWLMTGEGEVFEEQATSEFARFGRVLYHLVETEQVGSPEELAVKMTPKVKELIEAKGYNRSVARAYVIEELFSDINAEYLITGEGSMLKSVQSDVSVDEAGEAEGFKPIPRVDGLLVADDEESYQKALALGLTLVPEYNTIYHGGSGTSDEPEYIVQHWSIPNAPRNAYIVPMIGNSMQPIYPSGCRLLVIPYTVVSPLSVPFGEVFNISVKDEWGTIRTHTKVLRRNTDPERERTHWIARSINREEYDDFEIAISEVSSLALVIGSLNITALVG